MPAWALTVPLGVLATGALLTRLTARWPALARALAALSAWLATAVLVAVWALSRTAIVFPDSVFDSGAGVRFALRLDGLTGVLGLYLLVSAALLLTFVRVPSPSLALLATASSLLTISAAGMLLAALAWGVTLTLIRLLLTGAGAPPSAASRLRGELAWLLILAAGADVAGRAGTEQFGDIPVSAVLPATFVAVAAGAAAGSGLVFWRPWTSSLWNRAGPELSALTAAIMLPLGFDLVLRLYQAGGGHAPGDVFNFALAALGALVTLGAVLRAQAAGDRRDVLAELAPASAGFALFGIGLGTPLGLACGLAALAETAVVIAVAPLLRAAGPRTQAVGLLVAAGLPPTLGFAVRLLIVQAALEAGEAYGFLALLATAAWLVGLAAAARAIRLPEIVPKAAAGGGRGAWPALAVLGLGGVLAGALFAYLAIPAAEAVVRVPESALSGLPQALETAAGRWPALGAGLLVGAAAIVALGVSHAWQPVASETVPEPFFRPVWDGAVDRLVAVVDVVEVPAEFRFTGWQAFDLGLTAAGVWPWVAVTVVLALIAGR